MNPVCPDCSEEWVEGHRCTTGSDLREQRGPFAQAAVARHWPTSRLTVSRIEARLIIPAGLKSRYLEALAAARQAGDVDGRKLRWKKGAAK